ncbi:hypothetical protein AB0P45_01940 [Streptomyces niveus]|uniref:hypothetical protein n=1 Tax=Streptomyces niveus TaxID=193462 RepID=UPI00344351F9
MDALTVANEITPYVTAAVGAYGTAVLTRATDVGADATVGLGQRILQRIRSGREGSAELERLDRAVEEVAEAPGDEDFRAALRAQFKRVLLADPELAAEIAQLLPSRSEVHLTASGEGSIAVQNNSGVVSSGGDARIQWRTT